MYNHIWFTQCILKRELPALTGVAHWVKCHPTNQKLAGLIPSQGTWLRLWARSPVRGIKKQMINVSVTYGCLSPCLSPALPFSLKINNIFKEKRTIDFIGLPIDIRFFKNYKQIHVELYINNVESLKKIEKIFMKILIVLAQDVENLKKASDPVSFLATLV